jgi:glycerate kinase
LIAFDKLKGALDANEACAIAAAVLTRRHPGWVLDRAPLSDGGEGFCPVLTEGTGGTLHEIAALGPRFDTVDGERVRSAVGMVDIGALPHRALEQLELPAAARRMAIVELASVNGLELVSASRREVWHAGTQGTGELLLEARRLGADAILLGVGGSATSDLGLGALAALGLRFEDARGNTLSPIVPALWSRVARIGGAVSADLPPLRIACDVDNPLLGACGAAAVYGPQKGLSASDLPGFEREAQRVAELLCDALGRDPALMLEPGTGAAGGSAFGLVVAAGARLVPGFELVATLLDLDARIERAAWVLTGEGRFDSSSLSGKGPGALAQRALARGKRCALFAGSVARDAKAPPGLELYEITPPALALERALAEAESHLARAIERWSKQVDASRASGPQR